MARCHIESNPNDCDLTLTKSSKRWGTSYSPVWDGSCSMYSFSSKGKTIKLAKLRMLVKCGANIAHWKEQ
jgi:hypothetical protein